MIEATAILLVLCLGVAIGWAHREWHEWIKQQVASSKKLDQPEAPKSMILEPKPETPTQRARREQEELLENLNGS